MTDWLERSALLFDEATMNRLKSAHVMIVGLGGVGSYAAEFIARAGVGTMTLIDGDVFDLTNKNRQLTALDSTLGKNKAHVLADRLRDIHSEIKLNIIDEFVVPERVWEILTEHKPDYVMDCIDSVTPKIEWITACKMKNIKIITHLGAGGKIDPSKVQVAKLPNSYNCKLGQHIKRRLKAKNINYDKIKCVFSAEMQDKDSLKLTDGTNYKKSFYGTISYIPALFGLLGASEVIRFLTLEERRANN